MNIFFLVVLLLLTVPLIIMLWTVAWFFVCEAWNIIQTRRQYTIPNPDNELKG